MHLLEQCFPPHHLHEGFGIKGKQVTTLRLPSLVEIVGIRPTNPWTIMHLRDNGATLVCVQGWRTIFHPCSYEQMVRFLWTQQVIKKNTFQNIISCPIPNSQDKSAFSLTHIVNRRRFLVCSWTWRKEEGTKIMGKHLVVLVNPRSPRGILVVLFV